MARKGNKQDFAVMGLGRLGTLTMVVAWGRQRPPAGGEYPEERLLMG